MRDDTNYRTDRIRGNAVQIGSESVLFKGFKTQILVCIVLLLAMGIVKISPQGKFLKTKNAINLILTYNTDIQEQAEKIKSIFVSDENIDAISPVAGFVNPAPEGTLTVGFGVQDADNSEFHYGVDIELLPKGDIVAAADGEVCEIATNSELGSYITIKHSDEIFTTYAHLGEILPDIGEKVSSGKAIARAAGGNNTFYFEIRRNDTYLDPAEFIDFGEGK